MTGDADITAALPTGPWRQVRLWLTRLSPLIGVLFIAGAIMLLVPSWDAALSEYSFVLHEATYQAPDSWAAMRPLIGPFLAHFLHRAALPFIGAFVLAGLGAGLIVRAAWVGKAGPILLLAAPILFLVAHYRSLYLFVDLRGLALLPLAPLLLLVGHRAARPVGRPRSATWLSRVVGAVLIQFGIANAILVFLRPHYWRGSSEDAAILAFEIAAPLVVAVATVVAGVGVALKRQWAADALAFAAIGSIALAPSIASWEEYRWPFFDIWPPSLGMAFALFGLAVLYLTWSNARPLPPPRSVAVIPSDLPDPVVTVPSGEGWNLALREALADPDAAPPKRPNFLLPIVVASFLTATVIVVFRVWLARPSATLEHAVYIRTAMLMVGTIAADPIIRYFRRRLLANRAVRAADQLAAPDARRPVLYLRSFALDETIAQPPLGAIVMGASSHNTSEQAMVASLGRLGPVIAIGRPGERLPPSGAARFYSADDTWRSKVANAAAAAQLVVWTSGTSPGLVWEIGYLLREVPFDRLAIWAHPHLLGLARAEREAEWRHFTATLGTMFPKPFPEELGATRFFTLAPDGKPLRVPMRGSFPGAVGRALVQFGMEAGVQAEAAALLAAGRATRD